MTSILKTEDHGSIDLVSHHHSPSLASLTSPNLSSPLASTKLSQSDYGSIQPVSLQPPRYVCDICGAIFARASGLRLHIVSRKEFIGERNSKLSIRS